MKSREGYWEWGGRVPRPLRPLGKTERLTLARAHTWRCWSWRLGSPSLDQPQGASACLPRAGLGGQAASFVPLCWAVKGQKPRSRLAGGCCGRRLPGALPPRAMDAGLLHNRPKNNPEGGQCRGDGRPASWDPAR